MSKTRAPKPKTSEAPSPLRTLAKQLREAVDKYVAEDAEMRATEKQALAEAAGHHGRGEYYDADKKSSQASECRSEQGRSMNEAGAAVGKIIRRLAVHDGFPGGDTLKTIVACADARPWDRADTTGADFAVFSLAVSGGWSVKRNARRRHVQTIKSWSKTHTPKVREKRAFGERASSRWFVDVVLAMADVVDEHATRVGEPPDTSRAITGATSRAAETEAREAAPGPTHSEDYTSVNWFGKRYAFTKGNQAKTVQALWVEWERGCHSLSRETIKEKIGSSAEGLVLAKVFRVRAAGGGCEPHPAWGTMIQRAGKGCYHLVRPPESA